MEDALGYFGLTPDLSLLIGLVVGGIAVKCVLHMVAMRYVGYAVAAVATDLRAELIKSLLNVRWEYFTKQPLGRIANAVSVDRSEEHTSELQSLMRISYAVFCLKKKKQISTNKN